MSDGSASSQQVAMKGSSSVSTSVNYPRLNKANAESIRVFLRLYDQYVEEVRARAQQLVPGEVSTEAVRPVKLKFCVDPEYLESIIALGFIKDVQSYESLTDEILRQFLETKSQESKESVTIDILDKIVDRSLKMDMTDRNAESRMQNLFVSYHGILRRNGIAWLLTANQSVAVGHVLSAVRPTALHDRLTSDLEFAYSDLRNDFKGFMAHAIKLSSAFQIIDNGPPSNDKTVNRTRAPRNKGRGVRKEAEVARDTPTPAKNPSSHSTRPTPLCLHAPCRAKGLRHYISDCTASSNEEKTAMYKELAAIRAKDGPAKSTRSQQNEKDGSSSAGNKTSTGTSGRLHGNSAGKVRLPASPSCQVTVADGKATFNGTGRCDDGSDDSIVSRKLAEAAVLRGVGKFTPITAVRLSVALKSGDEAEQFSFSRTWTVPRLVLHLAAGQLALLNVTFLVADDELSCEDLLIGLPVLQHLRVDTRTLLENQRAALDGADCSSVLNAAVSDASGKLGRLMIARLNRAGNAQAQMGDAHRPRVDYYEARARVDPFPDPSLIDPVDSGQAEEVSSAVEHMLQCALKVGMPPADAQQLKAIVDNHVDIFRTTFSSGPPAKLKPLKIQLTPDARPTRVKLRNYSKEQQEFLSKFVATLIATGMAYSNPTSPWACAPLLVPKPGAAKFRFTVDLRPVNRFTVRHQYPMPNIENELTKLGSSRFFATFDLSHGYWQLELDESSRVCQSFVTPDGIYTPTRVLHGTTNAVTHLQSALAEIIPDDLRPNLLYWLDDILIHAPAANLFIQAIEKFFSLCVQWNLKLHPAKCILYATEIRWCGRMLSASGIRYDPRRLEGLMSMAPPRTGADLQQFLCALQWLKQGIPNFTALVAPLHDILEIVYDRAGKRTKRAVARITLDSVGWGPSEKQAFDDCRGALAHQVTLAHRDDAKRLCIFTDASDTAWSGILTQVPFHDTCKPFSEQNHVPLGFLSGRFSQTQLGWSTLEKEAYAVMATLTRMHWLASCPSGFDLFTDHNNLIFLFDPLSVVPDLSQTSLRKVLRWAVQLSVYNYTCVHIKGAENVWADLMSRWALPLTVRRLVQIPTLPSSSAPDFEWPTSAALLDVQNRHRHERPPHLVLVDGLWCTPGGAKWIPDEASDMQLRLCVIAHTGPSGHRAIAATLNALRSCFHWSTMTSDVQAFVRACIHCLSTVGGGKVPRPFGPAVHGTKPNDLLQFDYIELGPSQAGDKYVLMLRDDHSDYKWFFAFAGESAENAALAIIDWCAAFGVPNCLMSDGPTHFKNETVRLVSKGLKVPHHFTLPYTPWSNGAVERLGRELLRVFRAVASELQMRLEEWPDILPLVQSVLNNAPSPSRGNVAPLTAFTGQDPSPPISTFMRTETAKPVTMSQVQRERALNIEKLVAACAELHPMVQRDVQENRRRMRESRSAGKLPNFAEGDFVLVAREDFSAGQKLALRWRGPRRIVKALGNYVFQVEDLRNGQVAEAHGTRLKFYADSSLDQAAIMSHVLSSETGMPVSRLIGFVDEPSGLKVQVRWKGLPPTEDTFEPLERIYEDVPALLLKMMSRKNAPAKLVAKAKSLLGL
jgi:transposase InsO family protein